MGVDEWDGARAGGDRKDWIGVFPRYESKKEGQKNEDGGERGLLWVMAYCLGGFII